MDKVQSYYNNNYDENSRMQRYPLEFMRSKEIISRYFTKASMDIADIGGATGPYSFWLASLGHNAHLLDFTPLHIEQAKEYGQKHGISLASYHCGDARQLPYDDNSFDMVLLMGPLYHLQDQADRLQCLAEARRVLKPGGALLCTAISRYAAMLDGFGRVLIDDERFFGIMDEGLATGRHLPGDTPYFTQAYFHIPSELADEVAQAGFDDVDLIAIEGFARAVNADELLKNEKHTKALLEYIRKTERVPEMMGVSDHFFAVSRK